MIEHGTVVGNVSRTHRPCGACRELVYSCEHLRRQGPAKARTAEQRAADNVAREQRRARDRAAVADLRRAYGGGA